MKIFLVGGAVRDQELGIKPKDCDYVVVGSTPEEMLSLGFEQVGADFPVFLHPQTREEYALARTERKNGIGYHGFEVSFDKSVTLRDDLERRDLTINAMARDGDQLFDPFGGLDDLNNKVLRHTSAAFAEDPLRVLRVCRFYARFKIFTIHPDTMSLCKQLVISGELNHLSAERFVLEISKVFQEDKPDLFFSALQEMSVFENVEFFKSNFAGVTSDRIVAAAKACQSIAKADRLSTFFAAISTSQRAEVIGSIEAKASMLREKFFSINTDLDFVKWLEATRAFSADEKLFKLVLNSLKVEELLKTKMPFSVPFIKLAVHAARSIQATDFPEFQGPALGNAIREARRVAIAERVST